MSRSLPEATRRVRREGIARAWALALLTVACTRGGVARADDLRRAMEADNARWLAAFNTPDPSARASMYASDAILLPPGRPALTGGPEAIARFWEAAISRGLKEHTGTVVSVSQDGRYAYQHATWTVVLLKDTGERVPMSWNTLRVYELQPDGRWLAKVHMYNRDG